jgi:hypothetical protein
LLHSEIVDEALDAAKPAAPEHVHH